MPEPRTPEIVPADKCFANVKVFGTLFGILFLLGGTLGSVPIRRHHPPNSTDEGVQPSIRIADYTSGRRVCELLRNMFRTSSWI